VGPQRVQFRADAVGPTPVTNLRRLPNGAGDPNKLVGDYNNPILKPQAAQVVKEKGEISIAGKNYPDPSNQCSAYAPPFTFAMQLGSRSFNRRTASP